MRRWPFPRICCAALIVCVSIGMSPYVMRARQTTSTPTIQTNVLQVLVPVVVTDKKGHYVTDLKKSDFEVLENGRPQTITSISRISADTAPAAGHSQPAQNEASPQPSAKPAPTEPLRRTYLVVVDTLHSSFANFARVRKALTKYFKQEHSEDSQYALMAIGRQIEAVQDSTRDPSLILAALQGSSFQKMIQQSESSNLAFETQKFTGLMSAYCLACGCQTIPVNPDQQPLCLMRTRMVQAELTRFGERAQILDENFLAQIKQLVSAVASMPTSRTVIFISDGFDRSPGRQLYAILRGYGPLQPSFSLNPRDTQTELDAILQEAAKYNVKFYTLDSRGLYTTASFAGSSLDASQGGVSPEAVDMNLISVAHESTDALAELAHQTGGVFFENNNDLLKGIEKAFADSRDYYLLAYSPANTSFDGKYRTIRVKVKGKGLTVNAKAGYWAMK